MRASTRASSWAPLITLRRAIYRALERDDGPHHGYNPGPFVLCYHSISNNGWRFAVTPENLRRQMAYLTHHYQPITARQLEGFICDGGDVPSHGFVVSFDDGYRDVLQAVPLFQSLNIHPVLFALSDAPHAHSELSEADSELVCEADLRCLQGAGWEIGCHSSTHPDLTKLREPELSAEIDGAKQRLEAILGGQVRYFAYPKGRYSGRVSTRCAGAGYRLAFSMDDQVIKPAMDAYAVPRIGVDGSHNMAEFRCLMSPRAIVIRGFAKYLARLLVK
jgi:peptidoglycan/xylan/chitin deacetylase (PgdA/CDA1 family)